MPLPLFAHSFHISCGSCLLAARAKSPRSAPRLALRFVGRGGRLRRPCLLTPLPLCRRASGLASACSAGCRDGVRRFEKKAGGDVCFPVRLSVLLSDVIYASVVVIQIALLADDITVRSARANMRISIAWLELLAHAKTACSAFDI